jgi:chemotaxis protein MotB
LLEAEERLAERTSTIEAQSETLQSLRSEIATLAALREQLRGEVADLEARLSDLQLTAAAREEALSDSLTVQMALRQEVEALRRQLGRIESVLAEREDVIEAQTARIDDLDTRLAAALAQEVDELRRFRSNFFGRLREVLGEREDVRIVGDRFVFQSEVLFDRGEAQLGPAARAQLRDLADTLDEVTADIPEDLPWILQINGHTDRRPISTFRFPSNWELSTARAISVATFLIDQGIPADRVAAAGFAEHQPIDPRDTDEAYRRNRRIEVKLTTR